MSNIMADLAVRVGFDGAELTQGLKNASKDLGDFGSKARAAVPHLATLGAAAAAAGASVAAALVAKGMQAIDAQADLAAQLKTTSASMAVLQRAGDLSGASIEQISAAGKKLAVVMGQADAGSKAASATFDQLGLSASQLSAMPLDERINAINEAIKANIPATQQAAVAAQMFGKEAGFAVSQISGDALAQARREAELFGLAISEVDAARVQQAADEFGKIGLLTDGVIQQLTVNLAPAITAVMRMFTETAEEAGGVGKSVAQASGVGIQAFGFLMDVIEGVKRAFSLVADAAIVGFLTMQKNALFVADGIVNGPISALNAMIALLNKLPGIEIEPVALTNLGETIKGQMAVVNGAIGEAMGHMRETLERPMPSGVFAQYVEDAKAAAEEAAKVSQALLTGSVDSGTVDTGGGGDVASGDSTTKGDPEAKLIADRLERLREANMTELQLLADKQMAELEAINAGWEQKLLTEESWNSLMLETRTRHEQEISAIVDKEEKSRTKMKEDEAAKQKAAAMKALSDLSTLMNSENKKQFEIGKKAAIARTMINTYEAAMGAYTAMASIPYVGPALGIAAAAAAVASGMQQVSAIRSQSFGGGGGATAPTSSSAPSASSASAPTGGDTGGGSGGTLTVQGLSASSLFSGDAVAALAEELLDYQAKGGQIVFAG